MKKSIPQFEPMFDDQDAQAVSNVIQSGYLNESELTRRFEHQFAEFVGARYAVATTSGTAAIFLALKSAGVGVGEMVIAPDYTAIGSVNGIRLTGAKPLLADVRTEDGNLKVDRSINQSKAITAMLLVHINGRSASIVNAQELCKENNWALVEDASQCLGSRCVGRHLGTFGELGCWSLATTKIITVGQGGMVTTNDEKLHQKLQALKDQGRIRDLSQSEQADCYSLEGYNFKFNEMAAALGLSQLKKLPVRIDHKRTITREYHMALEQMGIAYPPEHEGELLWYIDIILAHEGENRKLKSFLKQHGVDSRLFYTPIHRQPSYTRCEEFPNADWYSSRGLWLPSSCNLSHDEVQFVCEAIRQWKKE